MSWAISSENAMAASSASKREASRQGGGPPKHKKQQFGEEGEDDDEELGECGTSLMKLSLNTEQRNRELEGAVYTTVLIPRGSPVCMAAMQAGATYAQEAKKNPMSHGRGPPHIHVGLAVLEALSKTEDTENLGLVKKLLEKLRASTIPQACRSVRAFKVKECHDKPGQPKQNRVTMKIEGGVIVKIGEELYENKSYEDAVLAMLENIGAEYKPGAPPAGDQARKVRKALNAVLRV